MNRPRFSTETPPSHSRSSLSPKPVQYSQSTQSSANSSPDHHYTIPSKTDLTHTQAPSYMAKSNPRSNQGCKTIPSKHKTQLCKTFSELGYCRYGDKCRFAHGHSQLKVVPVNNENYRKKKCKGFWANGECKYGIRCQFDHLKADWSDKLAFMVYGVVLMRKDSSLADTDTSPLQGGQDTRLRACETQIDKQSKLLRMLDRDRD